MKKFWGREQGGEGQIRYEIRGFVIQNCSLGQCLTFSRAETSKQKIIKKNCGPHWC